MTPRKCLHCETRRGITRFQSETFLVEHAGVTKRVENLSGWRCKDCDEIEFDAESALRYAAAGDELVLRHRERQRKDLRVK